MPSGADAITAVDCHAHVMRRDLPLSSERHSAPKRDVSVEEYVGVLDAHGISHGVLTAPSFYGTDNSLLIAALDAFPARLRGTVIVAPDIDEQALATMAGHGVIGIRLNWVRRATLPDVAAPTIAGCSRACAISAGTSRSFSKDPSSPACCRDCATSGVNVVIDHFGAPDPAQGIADAGFREALKGVRGGRHVGEAVGALPSRRHRPAAIRRRAARLPADRRSSCGRATGRSSRTRTT